MINLVFNEFMMLFQEEMAANLKALRLLLYFVRESVFSFGSYGQNFDLNGYFLA